VPLHDEVFTFGMAYNLILPAVGRLDGKRTALIRGKSPMSSLAFYRDDFDEYPEFFMHAEEQKNDDGTSVWRVTFYDDTIEAQLAREGDETTLIEVNRHNMDVCPIVRLHNRMDLSGRVVGEVAPFITLFRRIDQDTQDRLVVQRKGAWAVRTIAGMKEPTTDAEKQAARIALGVGDFLVSEDKDTKFGSLPPTPLDGYIRSRESDIRDLSSVSQIPAHQFLGLDSNVGAEGLAAAEQSQMRKLDQRHTVIGEGHETSLRLAGYAAGIEEVASDYTSRVHWKATKAESFQGLMQGLGQAATQLGIPPEMLWTRIPDWTQVDTREAKTLIADLQARMQMQAQIDAANGGAEGGGNPAADAG
jgi:hypothetical protein